MALPAGVFNMLMLILQRRANGVAPGVLPPPPTALAWAAQPTVPAATLAPVRRVGVRPPNRLPALNLSPPSHWHQDDDAMA